jgi:hypothetical protein
MQIFLQSWIYGILGDSSQSSRANTAKWWSVPFDKLKVPFEKLQVKILNPCAGIDL